MNYKKLTFILVALFWLGTAAFAEIALKDAGNGQVSITFTYKDDVDPEMDVIGSFDNWTVPGEPMTKNAAGLWEKTITAANTDEIQYKFYMKGTWLVDTMAPDQKDDGFGGKNGLIVVADILSGAVSARPGAVAVATVVPGPKKPAGPAKIFFSTQTFAESDTVFLTSGGTPDTQFSAVRAYSDWMFLGDFIPGMPGHVDILLANAQSNVYTKNTLDAGTGGQYLAGGLLFSPFYYLNGNQRQTIDKFDVGIDSAWLNYETGYGNALFPGHKSILWETVSSTDVVNYGASTLTGGWWPGRVPLTTSFTPGTRTLTAGSGFSSFTLGKDLREWGDFTVNAGFVPSVIPKLNGDYGYLSWASVEAYGVKAEVQYDYQSAVKNQDPGSTTPTDSTQYLVLPLRQDLVAGAEAYFLDGFSAKGNLVVSSYIDGTDLQASPVKDRMGYRVVGGYADYYGFYNVQVGYAYRGLAGQLLYLTPTDNNAILGAPQTVTYTADGELKFGYWGDFKLDGAYSVPTSDNTTTTDSVLTLRPGAILNLKSAEVYPVTVSFYGQFTSHSAPVAGVNAASLTAVGAKAEFDTVNVYFKADNSVLNSLYNTVLGDAKLEKNLTVQAGAGLRTGSAVTNPYAFVLGAHLALDVPAAKDPVVYAQFVYNMDPFNQDGAPGQVTYDLTDFGPTNGNTGYDGKGALRVGVAWQF